MSNTLGLAAALAWPIPMLAALFLVLRDRTLKFRLMWAVMCFVGVGAFWMQMGTGKWGFIPAAINVLGPGSQPGFYKATIPAGALAVLFMLSLKARRVRQIRALAAEQAAAKAFSDEVDAGSSSENASKQKAIASVLTQSGRKML